LVEQIDVFTETPIGTVNENIYGVPWDERFAGTGTVTIDGSSTINAISFFGLNPATVPESGSSFILLILACFSLLGLKLYGLKVTVSYNAKANSTTIIEIRPFRNGWQVLEAPGVQPVFLTKEQAMSYAQSRASFRSGEFRILDSTGKIERLISFTEADRKL